MINFGTQVALCQLLPFLRFWDRPYAGENGALVIDDVSDALRDVAEFVGSQGAKVDPAARRQNVNVVLRHQVEALL